MSAVAALLAVQKRLHAGTDAWLDASDASGPRLQRYGAVARGGSAAHDAQRHAHASMLARAGTGVSGSAQAFGGHGGRSSAAIGLQLPQRDPYTMKVVVAAAAAQQGATVQLADASEVSTGAFAVYEDR